MKELRNRELRNINSEYLHEYKRTGVPHIRGVVEPKLDGRSGDRIFCNENNDNDYNKIKSSVGAKRRRSGNVETHSLWVLYLMCTLSSTCCLVQICTNLLTDWIIQLMKQSFESRDERIEGRPREG